MREIMKMVCLCMFGLVFVSLNGSVSGTCAGRMEIDDTGISDETYNLLNKKLDKFSVAEAERISSRIEVLQCNLKQ